MNPLKLSVLPGHESNPRKLPILGPPFLDGRQQAPV